MASGNSGVVRTAVALAVGALSACASGQVLEAGSVGHLAVTERTEQVVALDIGGGVMHSALGVEDIETVREGKSLRVVVRLALADDKVHGTLAHHLQVPPDVDEVTFGNERTVLWRRGTGVVRPAR